MSAMARTGSVLAGSYRAGKFAAKTALNSPRMAMDYTSMITGGGLIMAGMLGTGAYVSSQMGHEIGSTSFGLENEASALDYIGGGIPALRMATTGGMIGYRKNRPVQSVALMESATGLTQAYWDARHG